MSRASALEMGYTDEVTRQVRIAALVKRQEITLLVVILAFGAVIGILEPVFLSRGNITDIFVSTVVSFVLACGLTLVVVAGGFDFSVGSTFTLGAIGATWLMSEGLFWPAAMAAGVVLGSLVGTINALIIEQLEVPPIITTLGTFYFAAGAVVLFTGGQDIQPLPDGFNTLGQATIFNVPFLVVYGICIGIVYHLVLQKTRFGFNLKAVGGGIEAAVANGISARRTNIWVYTAAGGIAAVAGILFAARTGSGQVGAGGAPVTLTAISAVLIGGTSLFGGVGTIPGTALGALLFAAINNGLAIANVPALYSSMIIGTILVAAVALDSYRRKRSKLRIHG